ncbi:SAM-dependent methyltransferase [Pseudonocardia humida]|uniref:SAM-dependent methyltransferase n=1 Tax=Pseudonocardia humida TaxID=2800819 RepID=A0ABT1AB78_9PSEU|nr:SAM-dependent methyltransferase [Pseudonocardia humida]MCO1660279.1 SAM-dependent methyltransferase [Pseudonocardia humida]
MTEEAPDGVDTSVPASPRIWNYWLGGTDNHPVDREAGDAWAAVHPEIFDLARASRAFLHRTVTFLAAEAGVRQFLDVGSGLPTADNTHEVAQRAAPDARIVYVDQDPSVRAHAARFLRSSPEGATHYVHTDMHDTAAVLAGAGEVLDLSRPVAVQFMGVLGHLADIEEARAVVRGILDPLPAGSYLTINDGVLPRGPSAEADAIRKAQDEYAETGAVPYRDRDHDELLSLFDGLDLVEPGFVPMHLWRQEGSVPQTPDQYGGVGRKP